MNKENTIIIQGVRYPLVWAYENGQPVTNSVILANLLNEDRGYTASNIAKLAKGEYPHNELSGKLPVFTPINGGKKESWELNHEAVIIFFEKRRNQSVEKNQNVKDRLFNAFRSKS